MEADTDCCWLSTSEACQQTTEQVAEKLGAIPQTGLSLVTIKLRQRILGYNEFSVKVEDPLWKKYFLQFRNPLILLLVGSACLSLIMKQYHDAVSISLAIVTVVTVAMIQEYQSEKSLQELTKLVPPSCHCLRGGKLEVLLARELVPGDIVQLTLGDRVPADLRLFEVTDMSIDESSFTGESEPCAKSVKEISKPKGHSAMKNIAFMGTLVRSGNGKGIVVNTGERSEFGEVFKMMQSVVSPKTPLQKSMDTLGAQISMLSLVIIGAIMALGAFQGRPIFEMVNIGVSLAVAAIPEGLPIVVTVTLALGVKRMAKRKAIVKKLPTVETLGCVNVICSDKTGTITKNEMTVTDIVSSDGFTAKVTGAGYNAEGEVIVDPCDDAVMAKQSIHNLLEVGLVCNNAVIDGDTLLGQPTEGALIAAANKFGMLNVRDQYERLNEYPFSSEQKLMAVQCFSKNSNDNFQSKNEIYFVKGALNVILPLCTKYAFRQKFLQLDYIKQEEFRICSQDIGKRGLRVVAFARGSTLNDLTYLGMVGICDPPRPFLKNSIQVLQKSGVKVVILTGDARETATAIAHMIGLDPKSSTVLSGDQIDVLSEYELYQKVHDVSLFYRVSPRHKLSIVKAFQSGGMVVGMTGDGVNDGVALKKADIGIAMGRKGTDVCKEAADMILVDDDFNTIIAAVEEGKGIYYNIRNFVLFQMSTSVAALTLIALSTFLKYPNPLNAIQILWINIIMDGPPAQSLGVEPVDSDVLKRPPRNVNQTMITKGFIANVLLSAFIIVLGTFWIIHREMKDNEVTPRVTTMAFTCFVFFDMFNALSCRTQKKSIFEVGLFSNAPFLLALTFSLVGQMLVIYCSVFQNIFQTVALSVEDILFLGILTSSIFIVSEIKKLIERIREKKQMVNSEADFKKQN